VILRRGVLAALVLVSSLTAAPASAVTYGDFVDSPQIQYPEVVPVWVGGSLCSGTLIEQQIVLTAAHCVYGRSGPIQIAVGGSTLNSGRLIDVTATWYHPRYDATYLQNDIALLHLKESAGVARLAFLPSPGGKKLKNFTMAGWGRDQNGLLTGKLSALNLNEQGVAAAKAFKGEYNPRTMIGAGRFFANEALYGGGCQGDSGGPLYQGRNGSTRVVVGVTSWGAEDCVQYEPTIYTWVNYYVPELLVAITQVKTRAIQSPIPTGKATPAGTGPTTTTSTSTTIPANWVTAHFRSSDRLLFGRGYRLYTCGNGTGATSLSVQIGTQWVVKAAAVIRQEPTLCSDPAFPHAHSYFWIVDVRGPNQETAVLTRLNGFSSTVENVRVIVLTETALTTTTVRTTTTTSIRQTTTTTRAVSPLLITWVAACDGQQVGGQSYAGICVRWTNDWSIRTTQICGSVTMDGSPVTASVLSSGTGWQNSGSGCQVPEPSRDGKGSQATVFYVLNPSGNQTFQASFTVADEFGRTWTSGTSFSG